MTDSESDIVREDLNIRDFLSVRKPDLEDERETSLLTAVLELSFQLGWITEYERLKFKTKRILVMKKLALLELLRNIKCFDKATKFLSAIRVIDEIHPSENIWRNENRLMSIILTTLFGNGLLTQDEKLTLETKLDNKNVKENIEKRNFITNRFFETHDEINEENPIRPDKNPMLLGPIIKCILQYLNIEEIKKCRYISKEWKSVSLPVLINRTKIGFRQFDPTTNKYYWDRSPVKFFEAFPDTQDEIIPFPDVIIYGEFEDCSWPIEELGFFFRKQQMHIRKLELKEIYLVNDRWEKIDSFDITPWISDSMITKPSTKKDTILSVRCEKEYGSSIQTPTNLHLNISSLVHVQKLELLECSLNLEDEIRIGSIDLTLEDITVYKNGIKMSQLCVDDIIDWSKAKRIVLLSTSGINNTELSLDLQANPNLKLDYLELRNISLKHWNKCTWTVDVLKLEDIPLLENTQMNIKELFYTRFGENASIDISFLPKSLVKLTIEQIDEEYKCSNPFFLHDLESLHLRFLDVCFSTFSSNLKCPNLRCLNLEFSDSECPFVIDLAWIPKTVKILKFQNIILKNESKESLNLNELILNSFPSKVLQNFGLYIQTKVLFLHPSFERQQSERELLKFLKYRKTFPNCVQTLYVGQFDWTRNSFESSVLRSILDMEAECYVFKDDMGTAFPFTDFDNIFYDTASLLLNQ